VEGKVFIQTSAFHLFPSVKVFVDGPILPEPKEAFCVVSPDADNTYLSESERTTS